MLIALLCSLSLSALPQQPTCSSASLVAEAAQAKSILETAAAAGSFKTLAAAVNAAGLVETLSGPGPFTVFAPTDDAFAKLPKGTLETLLKPENKGKLTDILTYHVVAGRVPAAEAIKLDFAPTVLGQAARLELTTAADGKKTLTIDGARIVTTDIACSNGVIHVIDAVILPRANIVDTAKSAGTFKTLLAAAQAAGLVDALSGKEPLTVFAPTDAAFAKLPAGTVENLLKHENKEKLAAILTLHVVSGRRLAKDVLAARELATLNGKSLKIAMSGDSATVGCATISATDILAGNGVIHVIDSVILP
jgi:transforming growth factor-beta-induced protein